LIIKSGSAGPASHGTPKVVSHKYAAVGGAASRRRSAAWSRSGTYTRARWSARRKVVRHRRCFDWSMSNAFGSSSRVDRRQDGASRRARSWSFLATYSLGILARSPSSERLSTHVNGGAPMTQVRVQRYESRRCLPRMSGRSVLSS